MQKLSWLLLGFCLALAGCIGGPAISPAIQQQAGPPVSFAELSAHPDQYLGQTKVLGGQVMRLEPWHEGTLLTMDQHDLDSHLFPAGTASGGAFLVESEEWLSPGTYQPKSTVTIAGVVAGQKNGLLLLKASQIHFWEGPRWEKWYHPIPPEWYGYDPALEYWFTPPYFSPWMGSAGRH